MATLTNSSTRKRSKNSVSEIDSSDRLAEIQTKLTTAGISISPSNSNPDLISTINLLVTLVIQQTKQISTLQESLIKIEQHLSTKNSDSPPEDKEKSRSIVVVGVPESEGRNDREKFVNDKKTINNIIDSLGIPADPVTIYRMGKQRTDNKGRPLKVIMPSSFHQRLVLARAKSLRSSPSLSNIFIRPSQTREERQKEFELRKECRERNNALKEGEPPWKIYKGKIVRAFNHDSF
ncbi:unnamed protein product [Meloidogyne enterolobii]|uniref:Uncharacterized protein n=1 Tax=Meloidogyne enterolobii TaxID=390850 RepID=A0ACB0XVD5_MELEN